MAATSLTAPKLTFSPTLQSLYRNFTIPIPLSSSSPSFLSLRKTLPSHHSRSFSLFQQPRCQFTARADSDNGTESPRQYDFDLFTIAPGAAVCVPRASPPISAPLLPSASFPLPPYPLTLLGASAARK
ncbi:unnamed protein product [Linum trigynum]|uniref:Uncharacterized protein n=1 Tax=Linum trigynum TaxID=586398 RepID=A0AAV2E238_9ROSI